MGKPAARVGDMHVCPMSDGPKPHVGGVILPPGCPTVLIGGMPAARLGDMGQCVSPAPNAIILGSTGVMIGGMPAARMGDQMAHGGMITLGCPTVMIGEVSVGVPGVGVAMAAMAAAVSPTFPASAAVAAAVAGAATQMPPALAGAVAGAAATEEQTTTEERSWFKAQVKYDDDQPAPQVAYRLVLSDGTERTGVTDDEGLVSEGGIPPGDCKLSLPALDRDSWEKK